MDHPENILYPNIFSTRVKALGELLYPRHNPRQYPRH